MADRNGEEVTSVSHEVQTWRNLRACDDVVNRRAHNRQDDLPEIGREHGQAVITSASSSCASAIG